MEIGAPEEIIEVEEPAQVPDTVPASTPEKEPVPA
jgi:hypothetical protein